MDDADGQRPPWQRLSVREGRAEPDGPFEGVPAHLAVPLSSWLRETLTPEYGWEEVLAELVALRLRIAPSTSSSRIDWILEAVYQDQELFLDAIDLVLHATEGKQSAVLDLRLTTGGSVWQVNQSKSGLVRRVTEAEQTSFEVATSPADSASHDLQIAWGKVYGRHLDPSDAWDHAIKACEPLLAPIVTPDSRRPTLGTVIAAINDKPTKFVLRLGGEQEGVESLLRLLRLMWPNPDRHSTGNSRVPTLDEARDVVHLAVLIVNWIRQGALAVA